MDMPERTADVGASPAARDEQILLGDEAVARGAIDAGISAAYAYPGTPSTEIFQTIKDQAKDVPANAASPTWPTGCRTRTGSRSSPSTPGAPMPA
jgi:indolepyruvate ferredoxin oxidoreductase alpha subunit